MRVEETFLIIGEELALKVKRKMLDAPEVTALSLNELPLCAPVFLRVLHLDECFKVHGVLGGAQDISSVQGQLCCK